MKNEAEAAPSESAGPAPAKKGIFLLDDHPLFREGLAGLINQHPAYHVCGEASDAREALAMIERSTPDLVLADIALKGTDGIEFVKQLQAVRPEIPVLMLSMHHESLYSERALRAGAKGYLMKEARPDDLFAAIDRVVSGRMYVSNEEMEKMLHRFLRTETSSGSDSPVSGLSDRELEIFQLIGRGLRTREIAEKLHLSIKTIETYRSHIREKLKLADATDLVRFSAEWCRKTSAGE